MTYCVAWKKFGKVFMIADTAISSRDDNINSEDSEFSTFGEKQGLYDSYYVYESSLKIVRINESTAVCYSGIEKIAKEAIENIRISIKYFSIIEVLEMLQATYECCEQSFELIILCYDKANKIYHFKNNVGYEVEKFIDIGSGKEIQTLSKSLEKFIYSNDELCDEAEAHLAGVISYVQSLSIKHGFYNFGVGGIFFGLSVDEKINWCSDIQYYVYNEDLVDFNTVSIISRYDGVYSASGFDNSIKYFYNPGTNQKVSSDIYVQESIRKTLNTITPDYIVFYSPTYNTIYIMNIEKWAHNTSFRMWIRRQTNQTKFAFAFEPLFRYMLVSNECDKKMHPDFFNVLLRKVNFIPREEFITEHIDSKDIDDLEDEFDLDLRQYEVDFNYDNYEIIDKEVSNFKNIIIVDYIYFCEIVSEKYEMYKKAGLSINLLNFAMLTEKFLPNIASKDFNDYGIYILKNSNDSIKIDDFSMDEWFKAYSNCRLIMDENNNYKRELAGIVFETLRKYYFDESYFHLDKIIIVCDDIGVNKILSIAPKINFEEESPDILLVRNSNHSTIMDGRFRYIVIDYAVAHMFGLNVKQINLLESGFIIDVNDIL